MRIEQGKEWTNKTLLDFGMMRVAELKKYAEYSGSTGTAESVFHHPSFEGYVMRVSIMKSEEHEEHQP